MPAHSLFPDTHWPVTILALLSRIAGALVADAEQRRSWELCWVFIILPEQLLLCSEVSADSHCPPGGPAPGLQTRLRKEVLGACDCSAKMGR